METRKFSVLPSPGRGFSALQAEPKVVSSLPWRTILQGIGFKPRNGGLMIGYYSPFSENDLHFLNKIGQTGCAPL